MPQGKGTYGSTRGRPPKGRYKEGGWTWKKLQANADELLDKAKSIASRRTKKGPVLVGNKDMVEARKTKTETKFLKGPEEKPKKDGAKPKKAKAKPKKAEKSKDKPKKKFDYRNKMATQMSHKKAVKNARGRTASEIANDPSFYKNTSKGKYLRGIHKGLNKKKLSSGGYIGAFRGQKGTSADAINRKPSTKISAGNKWN